MKRYSRDGVVPRSTAVFKAVPGVYELEKGEADSG